MEVPSNKTLDKTDILVFQIRWFEFFISFTENITIKIF